MHLTPSSVKIMKWGIEPKGEQEQEEQKQEQQHK
jgi:hypothetical protein